MGLVPIFQDLKNGSGTHYSGPENVPDDEY